MENKDFLSVSEKFTSIQGEGRTMGQKSIFLRLSGCNILCQSESWICDTIEVWKKGKKTAFEDVFTELEIERMYSGTHLIITGGEPLLHQEKICQFLYYFAENHGFLPIIEIETNGTIIPNPYLSTVVKYFNVSPKLSNSGVPTNQRYKTEVIEFLNLLPAAIFKFVISSEKDMEELGDSYMNLIHKSKIWLMPAGSNLEELESTRLKVVSICVEHNFNFSDRLHISLWNQKTGV